ncbi:MAG: NUDIX domain-containing protein [Spirochaetales bacterium]|nr:NUDIX domain-containing protein [Spirochaetales bacterium]
MDDKTATKHDFDKLDKLRSSLLYGDTISQKEIDELVKEWEPFRKDLRPHEKKEIFTLVDSKGKIKDTKAPRWLCHLFGLRHKCVHVLLEWKSSKLGNVFILQIRSWTKTDSPGELDISVGGHVSGEGIGDSIVTAYKEMEEELGISKQDLIHQKLYFKSGYQNELETCEEKQFYNMEWRDIYVGGVTTEVLDKIYFNDNEVVGVYLCPESQVSHLLQQKTIPMASALKESLPRCLL